MVTDNDSLQPTLQYIAVNAHNPLHPFPRNFPVCQLVGYKLATSRCNGIWETTRHNRHNELLLPASTCCRLVADLLLRGSRQLVTDLLRGNWFSGFWALLGCVRPSSLRPTYAIPALHVGLRPSGFFCCWSDGLELTARRHAGSGVFCGQLQTGTEDVFIFAVQY